MAKTKKDKDELDPRFLYDDSADYSEFMGEQKNMFVSAMDWIGQWLDMVFAGFRDQSEYEIKRAVLLGHKDVEHENPIDGAAPGSRVYTERLDRMGTIPGEERSTSRNRKAASSINASGMVNANKIVLDFIGKYEAKGNYNTIWGGDQIKGITNKSLKEVVAFQRDYSKTHASSALGKYQFMPDTLEETYKKLGLSGNEKFSPEMQDRLALYKLTNDCKLNEYFEGKVSKEVVLDKIAGIWAAIPNTSGKGTYDGKLNKSLVSKEAALNILENAKQAYKSSFRITTDALSISKKGTQTSEFAKQRGNHKHMGEDRAVAANTPLTSPGYGRIEYVDRKGAGAAGKYVVINHGSGVYTTHMHLNKINVREGQYIQKGGQFGLSGSTGHSTGPHTHTETAILGRTKDGNRVLIYVDPAKVREAGASINDQDTQIKLLRDAKEKVGKYKNVLWFGKVKDKFDKPLKSDRRTASINTDFKTATEKTESLADNSKNMSNKELWSSNKGDFSPLPGAGTFKGPSADNAIKNPVA